jgi:hypothetical protein
MVMICPLQLSMGPNLLGAVIIGFLFGFFLERGGLGDPKITSGLFYLKDFTVPKVMGTGVLIGAVGIYLFADLGLLNLNKVWVVPTFFWPQLLGGFLYGATFFFTGYCTGTAVVGIASGRLDALLTIGGVIMGSLFFALIFPEVKGFQTVSSMGSVTIPGLLNVNHWLIMILVIAMAMALFYFIEKYEQRKGLK